MGGGVAKVEGPFLLRQSFSGDAVGIEQVESRGGLLPKQTKA